MKLNLCNKMLLRCRPFNNIHTQTALVRYLDICIGIMQHWTGDKMLCMSLYQANVVLTLLPSFRWPDLLTAYGHGGTLSVREQDTDRSTKRLGYQAEEVGEYGSKSRCYILSLGLIKNWGCFNCNTYISFIDRIQSSVNVDFSWMVAVGHF